MLLSAILIIILYTLNSKIEMHKIFDPEINIDQYFAEKATEFPELLELNHKINKQLIDNVGTVYDIGKIDNCDVESDKLIDSKLFSYHIFTTYRFEYKKAKYNDIFADDRVSDYALIPEVNYNNIKICMVDHDYFVCDRHFNICLMLLNAKLNIRTIEKIYKYDKHQIDFCRSDIDAFYRSMNYTNNEAKIVPSFDITCFRMKLDIMEMCMKKYGLCKTVQKNVME